MQVQRSDERGAGASGTSTSVQARDQGKDYPHTADTAPVLSAAPTAPEQRDSDGWLPRVSVSLPARFSEDLASMSLPSMSSGSYARLYASPGPDENRRAALCYVPPVALISLFDKRASLYRRFHAAQGLALTLLALALVVAHWLIFGALDGVQSLAMVFVEIGLTWLFALVCAALAGLWLWGVVAALCGKDTLLPVAGRLAERILAQTHSRAS